jgi:hypothetical protein
VTDHGQPNAFLQTGWDSPIHDMGELVPTVMTFSHLHEDHFDPSRIPATTDHVLMDKDELSIDGLTITPIRVCEASIYNEDNTAYLFTYKEMRFLHIGDAHAQIMNIENNTVKNHIKEIIPDSLDILFMTIEGMEQFIEEAEVFIDVVKPKRVIPMHYWSIPYKISFLSYLSAQNNAGKHYEVKRLSGAKYDIYENENFEPVRVIGLTRSAYTPNLSVDELDVKGINFQMNQNYPNPCSGITTISYTLQEEINVSLVVHDIIGNKIATLVDQKQVKGEYDVTFDTSAHPAGMYFYTLKGGNYSQTIKMMTF